MGFGTAGPHLSPFVRSSSSERNNLPVNLTRDQIENSPVLESHKPVSRQYEEEYYRYYGWSYCWQGDAVWSMSGFPILSAKSKPFSGELSAKPSAKAKRVEVHLQSAQTILGYQMQTSDEIIGYVRDFMMDESDLAHLKAEDVDWKKRMIDYTRVKTRSAARIHFGDELAAILKTLPPSGSPFPYLITVREADRATEFRQRCKLLGIQGVTLHSYRYAWAERAKVVGYPERFAQEALGHNSKAVHRAYAKSAQVVLPSLESFEKTAREQNIVPFPKPENGQPMPAKGVGR